MSNRTFPLGAFLTGLAVGAAAIYFADEKNREKTKKALAEGVKTLEEVKENPEILAEAARKKAEEAKKVANKAYEVAVKEANKAHDVATKKITAGKTAVKKKVATPTKKVATTK